MNKLKLTIPIAALFATGAVYAQPYDYCIHAVNVITAEKNAPLEKNKDVFISKDKIVRISNASKTTPENCLHVIDGTGKYLMPGLTDMHVHLPSDHIEKFMLLNLAAGVTTIRSMRGKMSHIEPKRKISQGEMLAPDLIIASP